jgi:hypothetical protein
MPAELRKQDGAGSPEASLKLATQECVGPVADWRSTRRTVDYRVIASPAVAEIVGDGLPWTVLTISTLSIPCR